MGRDNERGPPRGGRGGGRFPGRGRFTPRRSFKNNRSSHRSSTSQQQVELKFAPLGGATTTQASYATVKEAVIIKITNTFRRSQDLVESLEDEKLKDLSTLAPTLKRANTGTDDEKEFQQVQYNLTFQDEIPSQDFEMAKGDRIAKGEISKLCRQL